MSTHGMLDYRLARGGVDAITFREKCLVRHVMPFNGINPHSMVVMDNASIHHAADSIHLIESMGALVLFVPPYSPDLNAIEEAFSSIKSYLKANEEVLQGVVILRRLWQKHLLVFPLKIAKHGLKILATHFDTPCRLCVYTVHVYNFYMHTWHSQYYKYYMIV